MGMLGLCFLANLCNSTITEIYSDIIRVSHGFEDYQSLRFIAERTGPGSKILKRKQYILELKFFKLQLDLIYHYESPSSSNSAQMI
jgi:hypothetical protein